MIGIKARQRPQVIVHVRNRSLDVMLLGSDGGTGRAEPELLVRVQAEVFVDFENVRQLAGQSLLMPAGDRFVPPHGPFPARQAIDSLSINDCPESFDVVHTCRADLRARPHRPRKRADTQVRPYMIYRGCGLTLDAPLMNLRSRCHRTRLWAN